jgi:DNA-binding response OmpR family regulator
MDLPFNLPGWWRRNANCAVTVLLAMVDPVARRAMRQAVARVFPANFIEADGKSGFHHAVTFQEVDLIVADAELNGCFAFDIVEQIRFGRLHCHAFPLVVMLGDRTGGDCAGRIAECGADVTLTVDGAVRQMPDQLQRLLRDRRPFVVAPHYIGPERRDPDRAAQSTATQLTVPKPLAARLSGLDDGDYRRQVSMATHSISLIRRGLYAVRITAAPAAVLGGAGTR